MNRLLIGLLCVGLVGCASLRYPNWEKVNTVMTVYKKPCSLRKEEKCLQRYGCQEWYQKRATVYGANTLVMDNDKSTGSYYLCQAGEPINLSNRPPAWLIVNRQNPLATIGDYDKAYEECSYDAHKATIDTNSPLPSRVFIPTGNYYVNRAQIQAMENDQRQQSYHKLDLLTAKFELIGECMHLRGFEEIRSSSQENFSLLEKTCPNIDNLTTPCFVLQGHK